jgi:hypothetical protein
VWEPRREIRRSPEPLRGTMPLPVLAYRPRWDPRGHPTLTFYDHATDGESKIPYVLSDRGGGGASVYIRERVLAIFFSPPLLNRKIVVELEIEDQRWIRIRVDLERALGRRIGTACFRSTDQIFRASEPSARASHTGVDLTLQFLSLSRGVRRNTTHRRTFRSRYQRTGRG